MKWKAQKVPLKSSKGIIPFRGAILSLNSYRSYCLKEPFSSGRDYRLGNISKRSFHWADYG